VWTSSHKPQDKSLHIRRPYKIILISLSVLFLFFGLAGANEHLLSPLDAQKLIAENAGNPKFIILDVRTKDDYDKGHIEGAKLMNYYATNFLRLATQVDREATILIYCQKGRQSPQAYRTFEKNGYSSLYVLDGGISEWIAAGLPVVRAN